MPAYVERVGDAPGRPAKVTHQNRATGFGDPGDLRKQAIGTFQMVQNRITHDQITALIGKGQPVRIANQKLHHRGRIGCSA